MDNAKLKTGRVSRIVTKTATYAILVFACLMILLPFTIILSTSFKTYADSTKIPFTFFPGYIDVSAYGEVLGNVAIWKGLLNTLIVVGPIMFIGVFTSALSAYAFAKINFKWSGLMFSVLMMSMMLPGVITMTPAYVVYDMIYWTDTYLPLMVPQAFGTASCVFYLRQYFHGIPNDMLEAAEIDGLGRFGCFCRILLPLAKPALIAQIILWFITGYNDYFGPMLYLDTERKFTLQLVLKQMTGSADSDWPKIMASSIITMLPMIAIYFFAQKQFIEGIVMTGMKE